MLWVILGHVLIFPIMFGTVNPLTGFSWLQRYNFMTIANAYFSVDSFFVLSGFLVTYLTLNQMKRKQGFTWFHWLVFYFHRYWRLTPAVAITMLFFVFITPYFGYGPYAQLAGVRQQCPKYWWTNLLYINNFYPTKSADMCIGWVWYLANDMQFFVISPLILIPLYFIPWLGMLVLTALCVMSFTVIGTLVGVYDLQAVTTQPNANNFQDIIYMKPYCRITPYLVGMALGYIVYKYPKKSIKLHWMVALLGWIIASGIGYTCVYSVYGNYNGHIWTKAENIVYEMFCRFAWGVFLSWVIFACHYGYGGWVNSLLGHPAWAPVSRLTYTAYLLHPLVIMLFLSFQGGPSYLSLGLLAFNFAGISLISYAWAAIFSLAVEFPLVGLEKMFIPRD
ncbi:Nose resistant to fluoxetine protein 6 [Holothuria leucospilota]|uniref:Nose resistant to fluoxetine protein 6 n=1 Tax=Holothuria leucospilota TaxID=206669 RepID=A0A9Q1CD85_HOLLE|nr:Nose resistant to fluoxetine protein 6 [Holothuria leucospilota]